MKKYTHNIDFFKIWTNDMSYILGFWFADGCIYKDRNSFHWSISQTEEDKYILENISHLLEYTGKIYTTKNKKTGNYTCKNLSTLNITSFCFYEDMVKNGGCERKSLSVSFPVVPEEYLSSFVRGFFDGDGHLRNENGTLRLQFTGGESFLNSLNMLIQSKFNTKVKIQKSENNNVCQLKYSGNKARDILKWIYKDVEDNSSSLFLKRKYDIYKNFTPKQRTKFIIKEPSGIEHIVDNLNKFCIENGFDEGNFRYYLNKQKDYNGWTIKTENLGTTNKGNSFKLIG